jgi:hypothetical protein
MKYIASEPSIAAMKRAKHYLFEPISSARHPSPHDGKQQWNGQNLKNERYHRDQCLPLVDS